MSLYDLRCGLYQQVLADVEVDAVIADPPYSQRTHVGASHERFIEAPDGSARTAVEYGFWSPRDVAEFVACWHLRTRGWIACMTSHDLIAAWEDAYASVGRYHFAPVPICCTNGGPRVAADGPASGTVYLMVARPRTAVAAAWRSLPPHYSYTRKTGEGGGGRGKPLDLMRAIVADYSRPGDLVCDPCAGYGSTLAAALQKGRRAIGSEVDPAVYAEARARLDRVQPVDLFDPGRARQEPLL